jgi:hypothetical protein
MSSRDDQSWDYSFYKSKLPTRRRREAPEREHYVRKPRAPEPRVGLFRAVKEILLDDSDASINEIIKRLNTHIRVSPIVVSVIKTEFRHSLRVIRAAGLMKE